MLNPEIKLEDYKKRTEETRLESWKEIAAYLQRNAVTARRWEREEGLPVHRHTHNSRSSVYAFPSEIDAWRATRKMTTETVYPRPIWKSPIFALTLLLCLVTVGNGTRLASAKQGPFAKRLVCSDCGDSNWDEDLSRDGRLMVSS